MANRFFSHATVKRLLLLCLVLCCARALWTYRNLHVNSQDDFYVYDTAAHLVATDQSAHIYDGANTGTDPQFKLVPPETAFAAAAHSLGLQDVRMYVYPPLLADLLVPLSKLQARQAGYIWLGLNAGMLLLSSFLLTRLISVRLRSKAGAAVFLGMFGMSSAALGLEFGQATIVLLLLWTLGMYCHQRGWIAGSSCALALAAVIKLTPLIAIIPFLLWRKGKWLRAYAAWLIVFFGATVAINSPAVVADYFLHVMPAMSKGVAHLENRSIPASLQIIYRVTHGGSIQALQAVGPGEIPTGLVLLGKLIPLVLLGLATLWVFRRASTLGREQETEVLAAFALLSVVIAPVSWFHAFVVCYPLLVFQWRSALAGRMSRGAVLLLTACSLDLGAALVNGLRQRMTHDLAAALLTLCSPIVVLLVVWLALRTAKIPRASALAAGPA